MTISALHDPTRHSCETYMGRWCNVRTMHVTHHLILWIDGRYMTDWKLWNLFIHYPCFGAATIWRHPQSVNPLCVWRRRVVIITVAIHILIWRQNVGITMVIVMILCCEWLVSTSCVTSICVSTLLESTMEDFSLQLRWLLVVYRVTHFDEPFWLKNTLQNRV